MQLDDEKRSARPIHHHKIVLPNTPVMRKTSCVDIEPELSITGSAETKSFKMEEIDKDTTNISALAVTQYTSGMISENPNHEKIQKESDFEPFLQQAFMHINKQGKQYLTTERLNTKVAAYMQTQRQNAQSYSTSITSCVMEKVLCRPESRLSSSTLRRYPLVSRRNEDPGLLQDHARSRPVSRCRTPVRSAVLSQSRSQAPQSVSQEEDIILHGKSILFPRSYIMLRSPTPDAERKGRALPGRSQSPDTGMREPLYNLPMCGRAMIVKQLIEPLDARRRVILLTSKPPSADSPGPSFPQRAAHGAEVSAGTGLDGGLTAGAADLCAARGGGESCGGEAQSVRSVVVRLMQPRRSESGGPSSLAYPMMPSAQRGSERPGEET